MDINCLLFPSKSNVNLQSIKKCILLLPKAPHLTHIYYDNYLMASGLLEEVSPSAALPELTTRSNNSNDDFLTPRVFKHSEPPSLLTRKEQFAISTFRNPSPQPIQISQGCSGSGCTSSRGSPRVKDYIPCLFFEGIKKTIIYFHGNAEDLSSSREFVNYIYRNSGYSIIAVEFQGYSVYDGQPSAEAIQADAVTVVEYLLSLGYSLKELTVMGRSIGSGPAIYLATRFKLAALVLVSPFTSICDLVRDKYGSVAALLVRERFVNRQLITENTSPTLIIHGMLDRVVPESHAVRLQQNCRGFCKLKLVDNMTHTEFDFQQDLLVPLLDFFKSIQF